MNTVLWILMLSGLACFIKGFLTFSFKDAMSLGIERGFKKVLPEKWNEENEKELQELEYRNSISTLYGIVGTCLWIIAGILAFMYPA